MGKNIVCLWGPANVGKTSVIKGLFQELKRAGETKMLGESGADICVTVRYKGSLIGLVSQGDPNSLQEEWLRDPAVQSCDIIVCASRSKGSTVEAVQKIAADQAYDLLWLAPLYVRCDSGNIPTDELHTLLQQATMQSVLNIINQFILNK